jgi:hypothetical protein
MEKRQPEKSKKAPCHPTQGHWHEMNRKQRREMMRKIQSEDLRLEVVYCDAAGTGIDIGNESATWPLRQSGTATPTACPRRGRTSPAQPTLTCSFFKYTGLFLAFILTLLCEHHKL